MMNQWMRPFLRALGLVFLTLGSSCLFLNGLNATPQGSDGSGDAEEEASDTEPNDKCCKPGTIELPADACAGCSPDPITCGGNECEEITHGTCCGKEGANCKMSSGSELAEVNCYKCTTPTIVCGTNKSECTKQFTGLLSGNPQISHCSGTTCGSDDC